jgi:ATP-dependent exoDNAse (exonuclease V) beta subunit
MLIPPAKPNEKHVPKTFAGLLRATLATPQPPVAEVRLYEHGDARWYRSKPIAATRHTASEKDAAKASPPTIKLALPQPRRERGLERTSPSALEGGRKLPAAMILKQRSDIALNLGTLIHAWLAEVEWLDHGLPKMAALEKVAARLQGQIGYGMPALETLYARITQHVNAQSIAQVLSREFYREPAGLGLKKPAKWPGQIELVVHRERPFALRRGSEILTGSIDRLVVIRSGGKPIAADIIDFKTDEIAAGDGKNIQHKMEFYTPQLEAYREAAGRMLGLNTQQITARLVFLSAGRVESLPG